MRLRFLTKGRIPFRYRFLWTRTFAMTAQKGKEIIGDAVKTDSSYYAYMRQNEQNVLEYSGDFNAVNWGTVYVTGGFVSFGKPTIKRNKRDGFVNYIHSEHKAYEPVSDKFCAHDTLFFGRWLQHRIYGQKGLRGYWTEKFPRRRFGTQILRRKSTTN